MPQTAIFGPFLATMALTLVVWIYMYARRIHFIQTTELSPEELTVPARFAERSPPGVSTPSDNLKNLFEMPVLFYAIALYLFAANQVDAAYVTAGWIFVALRALHSAVHCTVNIVMLRFYLYFFSTLALWYMVLRAALDHFRA